MKPGAFCFQVTLLWSRLFFFNLQGVRVSALKSHLSVQEKIWRQFIIGNNQKAQFGCVCVYVYIYIYIQIWILFTYVHVYYTCLIVHLNILWNLMQACICANVFIYIYMYNYIYIHLHNWLNLHLHMCIYIYIYITVCVYIYIHVNVPPKSV